MFKKRNDEPSEPLTPEILGSKPLPPFRTWVVRRPDWQDHASEVTACTVYDAHMIDINPMGVIVFSVYFRHPEGDQIMQAPRYFLNPSEWAAIEEVNAMFTDPIKH